jgi:hypothetical protein
LSDDFVRRPPRRLQITRTRKPVQEPLFGEGMRESFLLQSPTFKNTPTI